MINKVISILENLANQSVEKYCISSWTNAWFVDTKPCNVYTIDFKINDMLHELRYEGDKIILRVITKAFGDIGNSVIVTVPESDKTTIELLFKRIQLNCENYTKNKFNEINF